MIKEKIPFLRRMTAFCAFSCAGGGISVISLLGTPVRLSYGDGHDEKIVAGCVAASVSLLWCGCDRKAASGEKQGAPAGEREEPAAEKAEKGEAGRWKDRLDAASAASHKKGNDKEQVKALNDVAALYAEGLQNGWAHPLDVRAWCDSVAEAGSGYSGETVIGAMYLYGTGIKRDAAAAREWFEYGLARPGSQRGNALYMLGMMYFKGDGVNRDPNKALELWHKASDEEHPAAMGLLGRAYMEGKMGFDKDAASGLVLLEKAANGGNTPSSVYLGNLYARGEGVPQDMERAMKWYEQAASAGTPMPSTSWAWRTWMVPASPWTRARHSTGSGWPPGRTTSTPC